MLHISAQINLSKAESLETELSTGRASLEEAQAKLASSEAALKTAEAKSALLVAELEKESSSKAELSAQLERARTELSEFEKKKAVEIVEAEDRGFDEAEVSYKKHGLGPKSDAFKSPPPYFIPDCLKDYAAGVMRTLVPSDDEEEDALVIEEDAPAV